jgi:hypothetical protein
MKEGESMRKAIRLATLAGAAFAALAFAGSALASFSPKLVVSSLTPQAAGGGGPVRIGVTVGNSDDPTAKVSIYVPTGYQVATPGAGTKLGDVTATAAAADLGGAVLPLTGELDAIAPTTATTTAAAQCGVTPAQTWNLQLTAAGQTLNIPMFVVPATAAETQLGYSAKLVVCLPPPDVPTGTPGRAQFGAKLLTATFSSSAISQPTSTGDYRWTSVWTPYTPGKGTPNAAGTVEVQSIRHVPTQVTLTANRRKVTTFRTHKVRGKTVRTKVVRTLVKFSTKVTENAQPAASAVITTTAAGKRVGGASGSFTFAGGKTVTIIATAVVDSDTGSISTGQAAAATDLRYHDLGASGCTATTGFGVPCADATVGGETVRAVTRIKGYAR